MYKKILAGMLAVCLLFGNSMLVSAEELESGAVSEDNQGMEEQLDTDIDGQAEYTSELDDAEMSEEPVANSWRYRNGERINSGGPVIEVGEDGIETRGVKSYIRGIDVSQWQGKIDWEKVKASGIKFAIIRCGFSVDKEKYDDKQWVRNVSECERLGIPYGVYIYSYAQDTKEALGEAEHVLRLVKGHKPNYPIYFDMEDETTKGCDLAAIASAFCNRITDAGYKVGIYSNLDWWTNYLTDACFSKWDRWMAQWNDTCTYKGSYTFWQYSDNGRVDGIEGPVDMNYLVVDDNSAGENAPVENKTPFTDVNAGDWYYKSVEYVYNAGIIKGMTPDRFGVVDTLSRAQFVTMLHRMEGSPSMNYSAVFRDVANGQFYTNAVMWAKLSGAEVVSGYDDGTFGPSDFITREQLVTMIYRYARYKAADLSKRQSLNAYPDASKVSGFAKEAMEWAVAVGIMKGDQGRINPQGNASRAECATIIVRYMNL